MDNQNEIKAALKELESAVGVVAELKGQVTDLTSKLEAERKEREELEVRLNRKGLATTSGAEDAREIKAARKALSVFASAGNDAALKAMSTGSDPDGGYLVVPQISNQINRKVFDVSPVARLARRILIDHADSYEEPIDASDIGANWVGELDPRPSSSTSQLKYLSIPLSEISTNQLVTQKLLDTSGYDLGGWIEDKIADKFARTEGRAFINGDGVGKPLGLLAGPLASTADGVRDWFTIQYVATGVDADWAPTTKGDKLVDLAYSLRAPYRANACWLMNRSTAGAVRKFKDGQGNYLWSDGLAAGAPASLLGFPVEIDEQMPDIASNSLSVAFGDFSQAYTIVEMPGLKLLRDPFSSKPNVQLYAYRRVGGGLSNGEAVKLLKFGVS